MMTPDELASLTKDDLVETYPLFPGMDPHEKVELKVVEKKDDLVQFIAVWLGITLGRWKARLVDNKVIWEF
jgi:hypothetical protein